MKCQILFYTEKKNEKNISKCCLLNFLPSMHMIHFPPDFLTSCLLFCITSPLKKALPITLTTLMGRVSRRQTDVIFLIFPRE